MSQFYCGDCHDPIEPHKPLPYGRKVPGLWVHQGENYLTNQPMSTLDQDERNQMKAWAHQVKPVDAKGSPMDLNVGRQFRRY
jgi:hypothetical protein